MSSRTSGFGNRGGGHQLPLPGIDSTPPSIDPLFFAIYVETHAAAQAMQIARRFSDRSGLKCVLMKPERLHISLHSLGLYFGPGHANLAKGCEAAATVDFPPFEVAFNRVVTFQGTPGNRPLVLCSDSRSDALTGFSDVLGVALIKAGLGRFIARSFTPHVTLLYANGGIAECDVECVEWTVREFVLVRSLHGRSQHRVLARWPLRREPIGRN